MRQNAFSSIFEKLNQGLNSVVGRQTINAILSGIYTAADFIGILVDSIFQFGRVISENWEMVLPVVTALIGIFMAYNVVMGVTNGLVAVQAVKDGIWNVAFARSAKGTFLTKRNSMVSMLPC